MKLQWRPIKPDPQPAPDDRTGALDRSALKLGQRRSQSTSTAVPRAKADTGWNLCLKDGVVLTLLGLILVTGVALIWISLS